MDQRLVIAILVSRTELQVPIQKQLKPGAPAGDDDSLIWRVFRVDDLVRKHLVFGQRSDLIGFHQTNQQQRQNDHRLHSQAENASLDQWPQQPRTPQRNTGVQHSEDERRADQTETRNKEDRKQDRCEQRADVVKSEHTRDEFLEFDLVLQDAQQQRYFESNEDADREDDEV